MYSDVKIVSNTEWNLGAKLHIKVQLHDDIRRIQIGDQGFTYDNVLLVIQQVFSGKLSRSDEVLLKYKDEDGDLVTIFDSSDLADAIESSRHTLKLIVVLNSQVQESEKDISKHDQGAVGYQVSAIRKELACIRDRVFHLLDILDIPQDTPDGNLFEKNKVISTQQQASIIDKNNDGFHPVMLSATQSTTMEQAIGAGLPKFDQLKLEVYGNSLISRNEDTMLGHFDQQAVASPYPNKANNQLTQGKRGYQPHLTSASYDLPAITVNLVLDEPSTQNSTNTYPQPSYSPQPYQYQKDIHQMMSNDPQGSNELPFTDQSIHPSWQTQMWTSSHWQQGEYNYTGHCPSNAVSPFNPYRRSPQPSRYL